MTCIHRFVINDVHVTGYYNGFDAEFVEEYTLACAKCGEEKTVDELNLLAMKRYGLISEERR